MDEQRISVKVDFAFTHCIVLHVLGANDFFAIIGTETLQSTVHRLQDLQGCSLLNYYTSHPLHPQSRKMANSK